MKKIAVCILAAVLAVGGAAAVRNARDMDVQGGELETGTDLDVGEYPEEVFEEDEPEQADEAKAEAGQSGGLLSQGENDMQAETESEVRTETELEVQVTAAQVEQACAQEEAQAQAQKEAQARAEAQAQEEARAQAEAQAQAEAEKQMQTISQPGSQVTEVSRRYIEDCGSDSGYWEITYSDGHVEYIED